MSIKLAIKLILFTFVLLYAFNNVGHVEAKGRGGGGRISRSVSRSTTSRRTNFGGTKTRGMSGINKSSWFKKAIFAGALYGLISYQTRRRYYDNPGREPQICRNFRSRNGTHYGYFICPQGHQPEDFGYCCGPQTGQRCCRYWDDTGRAAGAIFGIIIGVAVLVGCIACVCCVVRKRGQRGQTLSVPLQATSAQATYNSGTGKVSTSAMYDDQPPPAYDAMDPAPPYSSKPEYPPAPGVTPYPAQPNSYPTPYPSQPTPYPAQPEPYPAQGPMPYPAQPESYPSQPTPYPAQPEQYPAQGPTPYPAQPEATPYPAQPGATPYPAQPGASPYPPQGAPYSGNYDSGPQTGGLPYPSNPIGSAPPYPHSDA